MHIVLLGKLVLGTESSRISDRGDDFLRNSSACCIGLQGLFAVCHNESSTSSHDEHNGHDCRAQDERQFPVLDKANDESCKEGGHSCEREPNLLRDTILYQIRVGRDSRCNLTSSKLVIESDVLSQTSGQVVLSDLSTYVFSSIDETNSRNVYRDKFSNGEVHKIQDIV